MAFTLRSPAFEHEQEIPSRFTCDGQDRSPPLAWSDPPAGTRSLVLLVEDPDAPDPRAPRRVWVHWMLYNLPPELGEIREAATLDEVPSGVRSALNDWGRAGYGGPCPPIGRHRYFHRLYALDVELPYLGSAATRADVDRAMRGHVLGEAVLLGTYEKRRRR